MFGVSLLSLLFVLVVVSMSLSLMAWLLAGIPEVQTRPARLVTDLDLEPDPEREFEADAAVDLRLHRDQPVPDVRDLDDPRPREAVCP